MRRTRTAKWILEIIQEAKEKQSKRLNLSHRRLNQIPPEVFELELLESLILYGNQIRVVPPEIKALKNLKIFDLRDNPLQKVADVKGLILDYDFYQTVKSRLSPQNICGLRIRGNELPPDIFNLPYLTRLDLSSNKLRSLPISLTRLHNLTALDLSWNQLTSLPDSFTRLQNLIKINLSFNQLISLPGSLTRLQNLATLDLSANQLTSLPDSFTRLQNLIKLNLSNNQLISLPDPVYELDSLQVLRLGNEEWLEEPRNQLKELSPKILQLTNLRELTLDENPIEAPPPEVVAKGLEAIKDYLRQLEAEGEDYIYEAKLLIIGEAGAGKTSLAKKIENRDYELQPAEKSTEGIDVIKWQFETANGELFRVNIWDFGGQEIYHATHQFFLTKRSLYALVCDMRREDINFYYWLNIVELLSDNSPIFIVKNEKQDRQRYIPERHLRGQFTNLKETLATNLATNRGLDRILTQFEHYLSNLPHIGDKLPKTWVKVREALERDSRHHISLDEYLAICEENGFTERKDALQLSGYLHDLGVILHFQDHKKSPLYKTVILILKPEWGTTAVYRVLDNQKVIANLGQFTEDDLAEIWYEPQYANMLGELLELMLKFELCYPTRDKKLYIAPQLLTQNQPGYEWDQGNNLILRYTSSEFMPKGIMTRFIVAMHNLIDKQEYVWRSGVILKKDKTRAEVIEHYGKREIKIRLSGQHKRDLMTLVINELDKLYNSFHDLKYKKLIPCNCPQCKGSQEPHFYNYEKLREFASHGRDDERCDNPPYHAVSVRSLIDDVSDKKEPLSVARKAIPPVPPLHGMRQKLKDNFDDVAFDALCFDYFTEVFDKFAAGMQKDAKITLLLLHCRAQPDGLSKLWELIE